MLATQVEKEGWWLNGAGITFLSVAARPRRADSRSHFSALMTEQSLELVRSGSKLDSSCWYINTPFLAVPRLSLLLHRTWGS